MKKFEKALVAVMLSSTLLATGVSLAQQDRNQNANSGSQNTNASMSGGMSASMGSMSGMIGNVSIEEFQRVNQQAGAAVAAITPNSTALSKGDQKLFMDVAKGGMMQLEVSRAALSKVTSEQARTLAQAEVEEQTAVTAKVREIATAKGITMPVEMDPKTQALVTKMNSAAVGMDFDRMYIKESGVKGHQKLDKTMTKVQASATDENMKALASAALPNVRLHLQVSQAELNKMSGKGNRGNDGSGSGSSNSNSGTSGSSTNTNSNR